MSNFTPDFIQDFNLEVSKGNIPGHSLESKFGENPDIDTADGFADIWAGNNIAGGTQKFVPPTQARTHDVVSSDIADAGTEVTSGTMTGGVAGPPGTLVDTTKDFTALGVVAGDLALNDDQTVLGSVLVVGTTTLTLNAWFNPNTGRRNVDPVAGDAYRIVNQASTGTPVTHIVGLNASFLAKEEFIINNGTTNVPTVNTCTRINRMRQFGAVSIAGNIGNITATAQTDATITAVIFAGDNQTLQALFTVPSNKTAYMELWKVAISKKTAGVINFRLRLGEFDGSMFVEDTLSLGSTGSSALIIPMNDREITGGTDILVEGDSDTNNMGAAAGFQLTLVDL